MAHSKLLSEDQLDKVSGGRGQSGAGWTTYFCSKVEDDQTFRHYLNPGGPNNGCPHFESESGDLHLCSSCANLERS